ASPEFPLLERLRREAPGTFHHSQAVGEIAAAAAEAIGADAPLARVGGFYHDVGKLRRPDAFGENTPETCHRKLPPKESAALILAHTRDGTVFAKEYRLPVPIAAFIPEHHGTTIVEFFYKKAKEAHERGEGPAVREEEFRYPGPRPRSPETALVHLADSAEAASRALTSASVAEIRGVVDKIFRNKLIAFQFEECELSTADLGAVREVFVRELTVHRHQRPKYPGDTTRVDKGAVEAAKAAAGQGTGASTPPSA
ncbi:MAG: HDIG domain-containing protein, partial [Planctomycetales bacterium]|nr:HDIG domain-containing protein [Planctomycetales bacterium]